MDSVTAKYQLNASLLLSASVSPALAALHATRARRSSSHAYALALSPLHCPRCAHPPVTTRVVASSKRRRTSNTKNTKQRVQRSCAACGYLGAQAVERSGVNALVDISVSQTASPAEVTEGAPSSSSALMNCLQSTRPAVNKEAAASFSIQRDISVESSAKLKGKARASALADSAVSPNSTASVVPADSQRKLQSAGSSAKRQKKRAGLQEMLARSKEQKQSATRKDGGGQEGNGLVAFLSGL